MPQLGRRSAGRRVVQAAERLSDAMLDAEEQCFDRLVRIVDDVAPEMEWHLRRWLGRGALIASNDRRMLDALAVLFVEVAEQSAVPIRALLEETADLTVVATARQLDACEASLAKRFEGVADAGTVAAMGRRAGLVVEAADRYATIASERTSRGVPEVVEQLMYAALYEDDVDSMVARVVSPTRVGLLGRSGAGVLYGVVSTLKRAARGLSIGVSNELIEAGMGGFNAYARG